MLSETETRDSPMESFGPVKNSKRLIVDHIVLENFKSYAGRQVIGPFHQVQNHQIIMKAFIWLLLF